MKLLKKKTNYRNKEGKEKETYYFYLELDNGYLIPIKNTFKEGYMPLLYTAINVEDKN